MTTAFQAEYPAAHHPVRSVLRSTAVLALSLGLTVVVLVALASVVDSWA
jgi:hypothetical protein